MAGERWTREQTLAVLYLKQKHERRLTPTNSAVVKLAKITRHPENSICWLDGNFHSLDQSSQQVGAVNASKLTKSIWAEYKRDPERVLVEARRAYLDLVG